MKRTEVALALIVMVVVLTAACGGGTPEDAAPAQGVDISFKSEPDPPQSGENTFEAMVMADGQPVTDADVSVEFFMPAMPSMNMPEMRNSVPLTHEEGGRYRGAGNVTMAGGWDATVMVRRGGQELGSRKFSITAK